MGKGLQSLERGLLISFSPAGVVWNDAVRLDMTNRLTTQYLTLYVSVTIWFMCIMIASWLPQKQGNPWKWATEDNRSLMRLNGHLSRYSTLSALTTLSFSDWAFRLSTSNYDYIIILPSQQHKFAQTRIQRAAVRICCRLASFTLEP